MMNHLFHNSSLTRFAWNGFIPIPILLLTNWETQKDRFLLGTNPFLLGMITMLLEQKKEKIFGVIVLHYIMPGMAVPCLEWLGSYTYLSITPILLHQFWNFDLDLILCCLWHPSCSINSEALNELFLNMIHIFNAIACSKLNS